MVLDTARPRRNVTRRALLFALVPSAAALLTLAALRPAVKAQAASTASAASDLVATPDSVPLHFDASRMTVYNVSSSGEPKPIRFIRDMTLSGTSKRTIVSSLDFTLNGTTLFAGVTDADKPGSPWWSASGALLPTSVYDTDASHAENHAGSSTHNVTFAFRFPADAQGISVEYKLPQSTGFSSDGEWPTKTQNSASRTESQIFAGTGGARIVTAAFPTTLKRANIQVGIASGAWKTITSETLNTDGTVAATSEGNTNGQGFLISPPANTTKGLLLTVSTTSTDDLRVIGIGIQGQTLFPADISGESINSLNQITAHFSQPLSQIKEFRVETRPFQWVEFKDVALQPAGKA